jgi:hypothetical protein
MRVEFEKDYMRSGYKVFMFDDMPSGRVFYTKGGEEAVTITDGSVVRDDIYFCRISDEALKPFADKLSALGIKTDDDHKIAGVLEAAKYHLEDMRKLAKVK